MEKITKINLGCGSDYKEGWINVDSNPDCRLDMCCSIEDMLLPENSVDEILLSHVVMYLRPEELEPLLKKWHDWLKVGGKFEVETIDFNRVLKLALENDKPWGLDCIFGTEKTKTHQWGWNVNRLHHAVTDAGFKITHVLSGDKNKNRDFKLIATK